MKNYVFVCRDLARGVRRLAIVGFACGALAACDSSGTSGSAPDGASSNEPTDNAAVGGTNEPPSIKEPLTSIASPILQLDPTQSIGLGTIGALRAMSVRTLPEWQGIRTLELRYVSQNDGSAYLQTATRSEDTDQFTVLAPPIGLGDSAVVDVYADSERGTTFLGALTIEALPSFGLADNAGRYAELAMSALLTDLRDTHDTLGAVDVTAVAEPVRHDRWQQALGTAIGSFEKTIRLSHDAAVFNSPVQDPQTGALVLGGEDFLLIDRIFLTLSDRLAEQGILFDFGGEEFGFDTADELERSFNAFADSVGEFVATRGGANVIGSLLVRPDPLARTADRLSAPLALFQAALLPVILNNEATRNGGFSVPTAETAATLDRKSALLTDIVAQVGPERFFLQDAVLALRRASEQLSSVVTPNL